MNNAGCLGLLATLILCLGTLTYAGSERRSVLVEGKYVKSMTGRGGSISERLVLRTSAGDLPILEFPLIGYLSGAEKLYASILPGDSIDVRIAPWPPRMFNGASGPLNIMEVY
ncbi:MAG: hypothetical protein ACRBM6_24500 [Geminicoccales bacterium]